MKIRNLKSIKSIISLAILILMTTLLIGIAVAQEGAAPPMSGNAIMMAGWMDYAEWFVIVTLFPSIIIMLFIALSLHIARPMVLRYLNRMTLRLGADILWEAWIIGRDVMILAAVGLIGVMIIPRVQDDWNTGVFIPAFILGIITLMYKLVTDTDADKTKYMIATGLTALTLVAALIPFSVGPGYGIWSWEDRGHQHFVDEVLTPLSIYDMQQQKTTSTVSAADIITNVKSAMDDAISAAQKGDKSTALTKAQEADTAHDRLGDSLKAWNSVKNSQVEDTFFALMTASKNGDVAGMKAAQNTINQILDEYAATL
ncbi:MAG: hypothetical protein J5U19_07770 [Candidatus Methanoperedens sp.]|nr:hypothetical protein [Candidatus Methanoperedens sp.]